MDIETFLAEARERIRLQPWEPWKGMPGVWIRRTSTIKFPSLKILMKHGFDGYGSDGENGYLFQNFPRPGGVWEATDETCEECGAELEVEITVSEKGIEHEGRLRCPTGCLPK